MSPKRREGPEDGEGAVVESNKDQERISISSDLEMDEALASSAQRGKRRTVECKVSRFENRRITRSQAAKVGVGEECQSNKKIVQALRANKNVDSSDMREIIQCEEIDISKKRNMKSGITNNNREVCSETSHQNIETKSSLRSGIATREEELGPGPDQNCSNSFASVRNGTEHMQCEEKVKVGGEQKDMMSDDAEQGKEGNVNEDATQDVTSAAVQNGSNCAMNTGHSIAEIECGDVIKVDKKRVPDSGIVEQGKESDRHGGDVVEKAAFRAGQNGNCSAVDNRPQSISQEEGKVERKTDSDAARLRDEASTQVMEVREKSASGSDSKCRRNGRGQIKGAENIEVENKRILRSAVTKNIQEAERPKKEVLKGPTPIVGHKEKGIIICKRKGREQIISKEDFEVQRRSSIMSDTVSGKRMVVGAVLDRKRKGSASVNETTTKRIKKSQEDGNGCVKIEMDSDKQGPEGKTNRTPKSLSFKHSDQNMTLMMLNDNATASGHLSGKRFGIADHKTVMVERKGGILRALPTNKNVAVLQRADSVRKRGRPKKNSNLPSAACQSTSRKMLPAVSLRKSQLKVDGAATEKNRKHDMKAKFELLGSKIKQEITDLSKAETSCSSESFLLIKQRMEAAGIRRGIIKQKISDQIKVMLLNAGWKIDLRPRKDRCYDDSVYISPQGSAYWSITKAYDVYRREFSCRDGDMGKVPDKDVTSSFCAIPVEVLSLFKRIVVNKRRRRIEDHEKKPGGEGKSRKPKESIITKKSKTKHSSGNTGGAEERRNVRDVAEKCMVGFSDQQPDLLQGKNRSKQRGCALLVRDINQQPEANTDNYVPYPWRRTIFSWLIDLGIFPDNAKATYMNLENKETMLEGRITRDGILCSCCSKVLTASDFEVHAGGELCLPYQMIYVEEAGMSLLQCQLNAWERQEVSERKGFHHIDVDGDDPNDDTCGVCGDGGDLICCDGCPSTFHLSCLNIQMLPPGCWQCMNCSCRFCGLVSCSTACESSAGAPPLLSCFQCEKKYHQHCAPQNYAIPTDSGSPCITFCGQSCQKLFKQLQKLLGVKNNLDTGFSWTLLQRLDEFSSNNVCALDQRAECNSKVAVAHAIMDECFCPIIDQRSGINLIHNVVYNCGSNFIRLNYCGFYTFVLEEQDEVIGAACVRFHGTRLAEMPFIGTRYRYRRQGMCRRLLNGIESALCSLNVEKLVIPAIPELMEIWTKVLGFKSLGFSEKEELRSINILVFPGTGLLQKHLWEKESVDHRKPANGGYEVEPQSKDNYTLEPADESAISSMRPEDHASAVDTVQVEKHEKKDADDTRPSARCINLDVDASRESLDTSHASESQAPEDKSPGCSPHDATFKGVEMLAPDNTLFLQNVEAHCTFSGYKAPVPPISDFAVGSLESKLDGTHDSNLEAPSKSGVSVPGKHNLQAKELTVDEVNAEVAVLKSLANFYIFAAENGMVPGVNCMKAELDAIETKSFVCDRDSEEHASGNVRVPLDFSPGKKSGL